jgi:1-aminocyclopropane-1-carboxylate deaminase/D-cysteine desulfhydrase-like pyridoxal-dependent ACC family enzyme
MLSSPITSFIFRDKKFLVKRDDLLHKDFSGNKARKFYYFFDFLKKDNKIKRIISYGSNQSNAMYSLSVLAKMFNKEFIYYVKHISNYLKSNPIGNYKYALLNGMKIIEDSEKVEYLKKVSFLDETTLFIKEGGANKEAEIGFKLLAKELEDYSDYNIFLPSGTGVSALYLNKHFKGNVYTCSCVGDDEYLLKQWSELEKDNFPIILKKRKKYHFGKLYKEHFLLWKELKKSGIEFDLLYDPIGWQVVLDHLDILGDKIIYIHQGGLIGNESMLLRYKRKYG